MYSGGVRRGSKRGQLALVLFCVALLHTSSAFFSFFSNLGGPRKQTAVIPIDADCESKAVTGDCDFYECFEERHPCNGSTNDYALDIGWRYCSRFDTHRHRLNEEGNRWLNRTRNCSMARMLVHYRKASILCSEIEADMRDKHAECEASNGLCSGRMIADNKEVLSDVYTLNRNSASQFLYSVEKCAVTQLGEVVSWLRGRFHDLQSAGQPVVQSILPIFGDLHGQVRRMTENIGGELSGVASKGVGSNGVVSGFRKWLGVRKRKSVD